jgi:hypothetical protein
VADLVPPLGLSSLQYPSIGSTPYCTGHQPGCSQLRCLSLAMTHILMAEPLVPAWPGDPGRSQSMSDDPLLTFYWEVSQTDGEILL